MQSSDDLPTKLTKKKPKPNNKTKTLSKKRPGEDFKAKSTGSGHNSSCGTPPKTPEPRKKECEIKIELENSSCFKNNSPQNKDNFHRKIDSKINTTPSYNMSDSKRDEILAARKAKKEAKKIQSQNIVNDKVSGNKSKEGEKKVDDTAVRSEDLESSKRLKSGSDSDIKPSINSISASVDELKIIQKNLENMKISKTREEILAEREAKRLAKAATKNKSKEQSNTPLTVEKLPLANNDSVSKQSEANLKSEKSREEVLAEREAKKLAKQAAKNKSNNEIISENCLDTENKNQSSNLAVIPEKKPILSKAERRAIQEAQRAAKAKMLEDKQKNQQKKPVTDVKVILQQKKETTPPIKDKTFRQSSPLKSLNIPAGEYKVKLFKHLDREALQEKNLFINHAQIHPAIIQLGEQVISRIVVGSNARCISFLKALKALIQDYETPPKKEFTRGLEENINLSVQYLDRCRPLAVSVSNAHKAIQSILRHLSNDLPESELKMRLFEHIDTYIRDQIEKAAMAISSFVQQKISNGDVILTYGCSSLIYSIFEEAYNRKIDFRVIVVDSRPFVEGQELLRKLALKEIPCTYVLINAVGFIMPEVTKVVMGAHALLANGYVMARTGTAQVALVAKSFNVPVLVCCETHKFSERVQTDAIVYNELGNPDDLVMSKECKLFNWQKNVNKILPLNINYDITPPELVTAVVTEVAILPCTSVPVILRLKPTDLLY